MKLILSYLFIAVSLGFIGINLSCNNNYNEAQPSFYYYPKVNVYYDATRANYIYSLDSGKTWDSMVDKLNKVPTTLGKKVIIDSPVSEVWKANEMHRKLYGGTLWNIISALFKLVFTSVLSFLFPIIKAQLTLYSPAGNFFK